MPVEGAAWGVSLISASPFVSFTRHEEELQTWSIRFSFRSSASKLCVSSEEQNESGVTTSDKKQTGNCFIPFWRTSSPLSSAPGASGGLLEDRIRSHSKLRMWLDHLLKKANGLWFLWYDLYGNKVSLGPLRWNLSFGSEKKTTFLRRRVRWLPLSLLCFREVV